MQTVRHGNHGHPVAARDLSQPTKPVSYRNERHVARNFTRFEAQQIIDEHCGQNVTVNTRIRERGLSVGGKLKSLGDDSYFINVSNHTFVDFRMAHVVRLRVFERRLYITLN